MGELRNILYRLEKAVELAAEGESISGCDVLIDALPAFRAYVDRREPDLSNNRVDPVIALGLARSQAVVDATEAQARLYQRVVRALAEGDSENGLAKRSGLDRMTVRKLAGKR